METGNHLYEDFLHDEIFMAVLKAKSVGLPYIV